MTGTLSVQLYSLREDIAADRPRALARVRELGFTVVEPWQIGAGDDPVAAAEAWRRDLDAAGLTARWTHGDAPLGEASERVLDAAQALGVDTLVVPTPISLGLEWDLFDDPAKVTEMAARLTEAAANGAERGIAVGYHNHWMEFPPLGDGTAYDALASQLGADVVLQLDVYWAKAGGEDPSALLTRLGDRVGALHLKDGPARQGEDQTPFGTGVVDVRGAIAASPARWHVMEVDQTAGDTYALLGGNAALLVEAGLSSWSEA